MDEKKIKINVDELEEVSGGLGYEPGVGFYVNLGDIMPIDGHTCSCGGTLFEVTGQTSTGKFSFKCVNPECGNEVIK